MGTLVTKPETLYAAYLAGRLDAPQADVFELSELFTDDGRADLETALAYDLGKTDRRDIDVVDPAPMAEVVRRVRGALGEPVRITEEQATNAARDALSILGGAPENVVRKLAASILAAVNVEKAPDAAPKAADLRTVPEGWIAFTFEGRRYAAPPPFRDLNLARLPDKRYVRAQKWLETRPPQPQGIEQTTPARELGTQARYVDAIEVRP